MKKVLKIVTISVLALLLIALIALGLFLDRMENSAEQYNAVLYDNGRAYITSEFYEESSDFELNNLGKRSQYVINTKEEFYNKIENLPTEVDFSRQMVIIYAFVTTCAREISIEEITYEENNLFVILSTQKKSPQVDDAISPYCRYLIVVMDKLYVEEIEIDAEYLA